MLKLYYKYLFFKGYMPNMLKVPYFRVDLVKVYLCVTKSYAQATYTNNIKLRHISNISI
jgi:hypothetical protein